MDMVGSRALENSEGGLLQCNLLSVIAGSCSETHLGHNTLLVGFCCQNRMPGQGGRTSHCSPLGTVGLGHAVELHVKGISQALLRATAALVSVGNDAWRRKRV